MTSKERMLCAIGREKPDRLPVTIHQWQPYHLNTYMNGMTDIEAFRAVGLDASVNYYETIDCPSDDWRVTSRVEAGEAYDVVHYTIRTPGGTLTTSEGRNAMTTWVMEHIVKRPEDIRLIEKYRPVPRFNREGASKVYDALGDGGILRTFLFGKQGGCWQDACELFGMENMIYAACDEPEWVHEFLSILLVQKLRFIEENLKGLPFDLVETGGGASSNTVISPAMHREFCLPYDRKAHDALHGLGFPGGVPHLRRHGEDSGLDRQKRLRRIGDPFPARGSAATSRRMRRRGGCAALSPHVALIGGMDQFNILGNGTQGEIAREVERLFGLYGQNGGYICSASDHFFDVPAENLRHFAGAAALCRY